MRKLQVLQNHVLEHRSRRWRLAHYFMIWLRDAGAPLVSTQRNQFHLHHRFRLPRAMRLAASEGARFFYGAVRKSSVAGNSIDRSCGGIFAMNPGVCPCSSNRARRRASASYEFTG
jgi:hypothetical protein